MDAIQKQQTEMVNLLKDQKGADPSQDLPAKDVGGIPKGVSVAAAATYEAPEAKTSEAEEGTDAAPAKPTPKPIAPASNPQPKQISGRKTKREEFGYVALNTGPDPKKSKTVVPPSPSPSPEPELDLTAAPGGTKREPEEAETRKDITEQDTGPERPKGDIVGGRE